MKSVNAKGTRGLIETVSDLYEKDYSCFLPFDDHSPVDLVAIGANGLPLRLQIKYRALPTRKGKRLGHYILPTVSVVNGKRIPIDRSKIDGWALYMVEDKRVVYIPVSDLEGLASKCIRRDFLGSWVV